MFSFKMFNTTVKNFQIRQTTRDSLFFNIFTQNIIFFSQFQWKTVDSGKLITMLRVLHYVSANF